VIDRARHGVVVGARAEEAREVVSVGVARGHSPQVTHEIALRHGRGHAERTREPGLGGDPREEVLDGAHADRPQHLALLGGRIGDVPHGFSVRPRRRASRNRPRT
jgi:hypothetical protein